MPEQQGERCLTCGRLRVETPDGRHRLVHELPNGDRPDKPSCDVCTAWWAMDFPLLTPADPIPDPQPLIVAMYADPVFVLSTIVHSVPGLEDASMEHSIGGPTYAELLFPGGYRHRVTIERISP